MQDFLQSRFPKMPLQNRCANQLLELAIREHHPERSVHGVGCGCMVGTADGTTPSKKYICWISRFKF